MAARRPVLRAVALLELLAASAPAGIVPADVFVLVHDCRSRGPAALRRERCADRARRRAAGGGDHLGTCRCLVLVDEVAVSLLRLELLGLDFDLGVEERQYDLFANRAAELLEHRVALAAVLDEGILLGHCAEVDPVT